MQQLGSRDFLVEISKKVGIEGATEFLDDPKMGLNEVIWLKCMKIRNYMFV